MKVTIHRLQIQGANWSQEAITSQAIVQLGDAIIKLPLSGDSEDSQFGFVQRFVSDKIILGVFVQKFPTVLINYDAKTKEEKETETIDCGEYLFLLDLQNYMVYLQAKRSPDLPGNSEIQDRFISLLKKVMYNNSNFIFDTLKETLDEVDRDRIIKIFYDEAEKVTELELEDFDQSFIEDQKRKRNGRRQTYFNPIEEYQEAMEAGAIKAALNTEKAYLKAKKGESLKKDPISRALLEGSKKPTQITYIVNGETITEYGVQKSRLELNVDSDNYQLNKQAPNLVLTILGNQKQRKNKKDSDESQFNLEI